MKKKSDKTHKNNTGAQDNDNRRERTEEKLRFDEQRFRTLIEHSSDIISLINLEGIITYINPAIEKVLGFKPEERIGANGFELVHPDDMKFFADSFNTLTRATNYPIIKGEVRLRHKDGSWRTFEGVGSNLVHNNVVEAVIANYRDITERKQAEESLKKSEERYRLITENTAHATAIFDLNLNPTFISPSIRKHRGYTVQEAMTLTLDQVLTPDSLQRASKMFADQMALESSGTADPARTVLMELEEYCKDGSTVWVELTASFLRDNNFKPTDILTVTRDITDRKKAEETLKESEKKYRLLADNVNDVIFVLDMNLKYTYISPSVKIMRGYEPEEVLKQQSIEQTLTPSSMDLAMKTLSDVMELEKIKHQDITESRTLQLEMRRKDGSTVWTEVKFSFIRDENQRPVGILGITRDITERKKAEDKLRFEEQRFRALVEHSSDIIAILTLEGIVTYINPAIERVLGYKVEERIGANTLEVINPDDLQYLADNVIILFTDTNAPVVQFEVRLRHKDGSWRTFEAVGSNLVHNNVVEAVIVNYRDITERKRAEVEIAGVNRALRMLSDTNQALIHITDEATLLNEVCQIIVEVGGYHMAWVSFSEQDEAETVRPAAHAEFDSGYIESANVTWADNERRRGPSGTAIRTGLPCMARNIPEDPAFAPWHEAAIQRGYKSIIALPLISESQALGVLEIYSVDTDAFDTNEVEILKELAGDLAFGIAALRIRAKRDQAEVELRKSEERYRLVIENTAHSITIFDLNLKPTEYIAPSILKRRGYTVQEALTQTLDQMMTPDSLQLASKLFAEQMVLESSPTADPARTVLMELEEYCKDGSTIWVEIVASFLRDNNFKPTAILTVARDITERKLAEAKLKRTLDRLRKAVGTTIQVLVSAVETRDTYTSGHQSRSADLACVIAKEIGLDQDKIEGIHMAGIIHDIGKLSIPAEILSKPTKLTELQFSLIKEHSRSGYEILKDVESPWPLAEIVYQHHERINGSGYPRNLKGDEILMESRILAVADVVEAMASHRPYRPTLGIEAALEEIEKNKGILYDNTVADACLKLFREKGYQFT
ncbi:MAG: PAS domain S-box protein [Smithella sp.]